MPFPLLKPGTGTLVGMYRLGSHIAVLVREPESVGPIKYQFVLDVTLEGDSNPLLVVTCEHNVMGGELLRSLNSELDEATRAALGKGSGYFLCFFDRNAEHRNVEQFTEVPDVDQFREKAFALATRQLNIVATPRLLGPPDLPTKGARVTMKKNVLLGIGVIVLVAAAVGLILFLQEPKDFDDCILKNMRGVTSDMAARLIYVSCRGKY